MSQPLVSCIMPTYNRRQYVPRAFLYFQRQDYPELELIVVDDGTDRISDLVPSDPRIHYIQLPRKMSLGAKRNIACEYANGSIIAHWDDDDWYGPHHIRLGVEALTTSAGKMSGSAVPLFYDPATQSVWRFLYPPGQQQWVAGATLCYLRDYWFSNRFPEIAVGEDTQFVWSAPPGAVVPISDSSSFVCIIHAGNTSPKQTQGPMWTQCTLDEIRCVMGEDAIFYGLQPTPALPAPAIVGPMTAAKVTDMELPEYKAFNHAVSLPWMRRWELPYALFQSDLSNTESVLMCCLNPAGFEERLHKLYPNVLYREWSPIQNGQFVPAIGFPDHSFDRVICVNTLEHLIAEQRAGVISALARKLRNDGFLILTADSYFESSWSDQNFLQAGVVRADGQELFNGWNRVSQRECIGLCSANGLHLADPQQSGGDPAPNDSSLYVQLPPYRHACIAGVFRKQAYTSVPGKRIVLALLTWNTCDITLESVQAYIREAHLLRRLGQSPFICVVDNGSSDHTPDRLLDLENSLDVPHKFILNRENLGNSIARNQIINYMRECDADYVLFMDGDIEIVPFSSFAMLRHMEDNGRDLGCIGADSGWQTPQRECASPCLYSVSDCLLQPTNLVAWTQYGMFRREVFEDGIRFDEAPPFLGPGWGFEDNDLAFQMDMKGYINQRFFGMMYLHRAMCSSIRIMRTLGIDANALYLQRRQHTIDKWSTVPRINEGPLVEVRRAHIRI